jgi:hypothetical protein
MNTIVAPTTGRGAHAGSGGLRATGQTGPAVATPTSHGPPLDGIATGEPPEPPPVGVGVAAGEGFLVGVGTGAEEGGRLTAGCALWAPPLAEGPLAAGASVGIGVGARVGGEGDAAVDGPVPAGPLQAARRSPNRATPRTRAADRDRWRMHR